MLFLAWYVVARVRTCDEGDKTRDRPQNVTQIFGSPEGSKIIVRHETLFLSDSRLVPIPTYHRLLRTKPPAVSFSSVIIRFIMYAAMIDTGAYS